MLLIKTNIGSAKQPDRSTPFYKHICPNLSVTLKLFYEAQIKKNSTKLNN